MASFYQADIEHVTLLFLWNFVWHQDNDYQDFAEYKAKVYAFGNSPSPAVTIYGLKKAAQVEEKNFGKDDSGFVQNDIYADINPLP